MSFEDEIKNFCTNSIEKKKEIHSEETTKIALIYPFLKVMGYDIENPSEVKAEYVADVGTRKQEKVDIAVLIEKQVQIIIECKAVNVDLEQKHLDQLIRYYGVTEATIAILTNGLIYKFYTDTKTRGKLDETPFLEINIENITKTQIEILKIFTKNNFNINKINDNIDQLKYKYDLKEVLLTELEYPSDDLTRVIAKKVYDKTLTQKKLKIFRKIIKQILKQILQEKLDQAFQNAIEDEIDDESILQDNNNQVITTKEELEGYFIVQAIGSEIISPEKINIRDRKSYCTIIYDDNQNYPIIRLHFNNIDKLTIGLFNSKKKGKSGRKLEEKYNIKEINEIYKYKEQILSTIRYYKQIKK